MEEQVFRPYSLAELRAGTDNFNDVNVVGRGGFGKVYICKRVNGSIVAVKRLSRRDSDHELAQFVMEIETLSKLRHRHIVKLLGYCSEEDEMILVYEFIQNQTLAHYLAASNDRSSLGLFIRLLQILLDASRGFDHLHTGISGCSIIHGDVKSTNILLGDNLEAKVSDFGLAKILGADSTQSHVTASLIGTDAYVDPYFLANGRLEMASDTYSFGIVLLEAFSGRPASDIKRLFGCASAREAVKIVASNWSGEISKECLKLVTGLAKRCLHDQPRKRPTMTEVSAQLLRAPRLQQESRRLNFWPFKPFFNRVIPSGSTQGDQNQAGADHELQAVDMLPDEEPLDIQNADVLLPIIAPVVQEDASEHDEQAVDMLQAESDSDDGQNANMLPVDVLAIPLTEFQDITDNFSDKYLIAKVSGGGSVFCGDLKSGPVAAIKKLKIALSDHEFMAQVTIISGLHHENVVALLGYCVNDGMHVVAYEFTSQGSLQDILHGMNPGPPLSWVQRTTIAVEAAKGLCYIHENGLIHHGIKSSNVLVFKEENAKISDVCLSTEYPCKAARGDGPSTSSTSPLPSRSCYHPAECGWKSGKSEKGDVYSFGIVLLELVTGEKPFDPTRPPGQEFLAIWATATLGEDEIKNIVDARLEGYYPPMAAVKMAKVAASCLEMEVDLRPVMANVLRDLQRILWETNLWLQKHQQQSQRIIS